MNIPYLRPQYKKILWYVVFIPTWQVAFILESGSVNPDQVISGGNFLEIDIRFLLNKLEDYPAKNEQLIKAISKQCPHIRRLAINIDPRNLREN